MIPSPYIANLVLTGGPWIWAGVVLALVGGLLAIRGYRQHPAAQRGKATLPLILRLFALFLLALCLAEPAWVGEEAEPGANFVAVVADTSAGMQIRDAGSKTTRGEQLNELLTGSGDEESAWLNTIGETFALQRFTMAERLQRINAFSELESEGRASSIGAALKSLQRRFGDRPVAGVVLCTDGNATDEIDLEALAGLPPIFPVVMGDKAPERDLALSASAVSESSFEDAPITIRADVSALGYKDQKVSVKLLDQAGTEIETQSFTPGDAEDRRSLRFLHRPPQSGVQFYQLNISTEDEKEEATTANNQRLLTVNRQRGPYRVLYLSGRPNWEYKFLRRALAEDTEVELVGLIRVARREPKFRWRGRDGENANPLFRGFNPDDDTADYDQPVMVRLNTRDDAELANGFPRDAQDLFGYHAVIIDDIEQGFFTVDQLDLLDHYVSRRGGSLLMLGGAETFAHGKYDNSPIAKMLPVHSGTPADTAPTPQLKLELTRDGWLSPWMRLRENEPDERKRLAGMTPFKTLNRIAAIKPGASVLAQVDEDGSRRPALIAQRFGKGRVGALLIGDLWRWGFKIPENRPDMEKAWRQTVRWLIADVPEPVEVELISAGDGAVTARIEVYNEDFQPAPDARVTLELKSGDKDPVALQATPSDTEAGIFEATFVAETGSTLISASAKDAKGEEVGNAEEGWTANGAADEFQRLEPNRALLAELAEKTGGAVLTPDELNAFAKRLPTLSAPKTRTWSRSLWHTPPIFLLVLVCFGAEWIMRRRMGMA